MKLKFLIYPFSMLLIFAATFHYFNSAPPMMLEETLLVKEGETLKSVALRLKQLNLIENESFFLLIGVFTGRNGIKPGKYRIQHDLSSMIILEKLIKGDIIKNRVTIPEGYNIYQIAEKLSDSRITDKNSFLNYSFNRDFLKSIGIMAQSAVGLSLS